MRTRVLVFLLFWLGVKAEDLDESELAASGANKDVIRAINCGGGKHIDVDGIHYEADNHHSGIASDYGTRWIIRGIPQPDMILYQTERYALDSDLTYEFPLPRPGDYVLVMRFSEVYFQAPNQKVFDVTLNGYVILSNFDIFAASGGRAVAYDVIIPIQITKENLVIDEKLVDLNKGVFKLVMAKGSQDNPKINAFYLKRGSIEGLNGISKKHRILKDEFNQQDIVDIDDQHYDPFHEHQQERQEEPDDESHAKFASGPKAADPYEGQDGSNLYIPIIATVVLVIPIVICLLKM